jgi:Phage capsid family
MTMTKSPDAIPLRPALLPSSVSAAPLARPSDALFRGLACLVKHHVEGGKRPVLDILRTSYGHDDITRALMARLGFRAGFDLQTRAATIPADMTTPGWADSLVQTVIGDLIQTLTPIFVYPQLAAKGDSYTIDAKHGAILLPARNTAATVGGAFVGIAAPISVKQGAFLPITMTLKKMAVITTFTREVTLHSVPTIEAVIRTAMLEDTALALDAVLMDVNAATAIRPAGLRSVTKVTASVTASIAGFVADLKTLVAAFITGTKGNFRAPVWIMNPQDVLAAMLLPTTGGADYFFIDQLSRGTLAGIPVIQSTSCTIDTMILTDAADFITATGDTPEFDIGDQTALHMEDTTPLAISTVGTPNTIAAPVRSLWQTDSIAIKMHLPVNFAMRRLGVTQWTDTLAWN